MTQEEDLELFENNFHRWLERQGVSLGKFERHEITASINLNTLKLAIIQLTDRYTAEKVLEARIEEIEETVFKPLAGKTWFNLRPDIELSRQRRRVAELQAELAQLKEQ